MLLRDHELVSLILEIENSKTSNLSLIVNMYTATGLKIYDHRKYLGLNTSCN